MTTRAIQHEAQALLTVWKQWERLIGTDMPLKPTDLPAAAYLAEIGAVTLAYANGAYSIALHHVVLT